MDHVMQGAARPASQAKQVLIRATVVATILGSALALLNQSSAILGADEIQWLRLALLYITPFLVVTLSQALGLRAARRASARTATLGESFTATLFGHGIPARAVALGLAAGAVNTAIVATAAVMAGQGLDQLPLALIPYRYDYLDASNLLDIWRSYGRHAWQNNRFEQFVLKGNEMVHDVQARMALYQEAERILVNDVGGVFLWYEMTSEIWKPYLRGASLEPNRWGYRAWRGDHRNLTPTLYISKDVMKGRASDSSQQSGGFWEWLMGQG